MTTPVEARARAQRRQRLQQRQTVILGSLSLALLAAALLGAAMWADYIPNPVSAEIFDPKADEAETGPAVPCPPANALPVEYEEIEFQVLNSTNTEGLAGQVASELEGYGLHSSGVGNAAPYSGNVLLVTSAEALPQAYTLAALFPEPSVQLDARADASVDVVLGATFEFMNTPEEAQLDPEAPLQGLPGCRPISTTG